MSEVLAVIDGRAVGRLMAVRNGRFAFVYDDGWLKNADAYPLSVSMPLATTVYAHRAVMPYLWNLLPENPNVLQRWGRQYHVSHANPFKLLTHVGADVPGAAQFIPAERLDEVKSNRLVIDWMGVDELADRLRQLREDATAMRRPGDLGKMSLPGAVVRRIEPIALYGVGRAASVDENRRPL